MKPHRETRTWQGAVVGLCVVLAAGCSTAGNEQRAEATNDSVAPDADVSTGLTVTRSDGSEVVMPEVAPYVWCGPFSEGSVDIPAEAVHIYLWPRLDPDYTGDPSGWIIRGVLDDIEPGEPLELPSSVVDLGDTTPTPTDVEVFVVADFNDFASSDPGSSGSVVFDRLPCEDPDAEVSFTLNVVLAEEDQGGETIAVEGEFSGGLNEPPQRDLYGF